MEIREKADKERFRWMTRSEAWLKSRKKIISHQILQQPAYIICIYVYIFLIHKGRRNGLKRVRDIILDKFSKITLDIFKSSLYHMQCIKKWRTMSLSTPTEAPLVWLIKPMWAEKTWSRWGDWYKPCVSWEDIRWFIYTCLSRGDVRWRNKSMCAMKKSAWDGETNIYHSCPRVTFLGPDPTRPDPTRPGKTLTRPDPRLPTKSLTRPDPPPWVQHSSRQQGKYTIVARFSTLVYTNLSNNVEKQSIWM